MALPRLPDFIVTGAMKAGTSSLHAYLRQHPQLFMSARKETDHFLRDRTRNEWDRYNSRFADASAGVLAGESSPNYTKAHLFPGTAERIRASIPHVGLIYLARDPADRILSHWQHNVRKGRTGKPLEAAVKDGSNYLMTTRYAWQLGHYLRLFSADQLLVIATEDLDQAPRIALSRIFRFLGIDDMPVDTSSRQNTSAEENAGHEIPTGGGVEVRDGKIRVTEQARRRILDMLADDLEDLRPLVGDEVVDRWYRERP